MTEEQLKLEEKRIKAEREYGIRRIKQIMPCLHS